MDTLRPSSASALSGQTETSRSDALEARITHARIRMLYGHMPVTAWTSGGFIIVIGGLIYFTQPEPPTLPTLAWLTVALVLALTRALHAQSYFRSVDRQAPFWQHSYYWLTLVFSVCWGALPWALPIRHDQQLATAIIGVMIGMAATGTAQISSDRANVRAWTVPILVSSAIYCANTGGPLGWFGFISILGFLVILWLEADRAHRRQGPIPGHDEPRDAHAAARHPRAVAHAAGPTAATRGPVPDRPAPQRWRAPARGHQRCA